jgi:ABC-type bacteriocin/lantibiotic exporter with double-glycine peptidase domain
MTPQARRWFVFVSTLPLASLLWAGCAGAPGYRGTAVPAEQPQKLAKEDGWIVVHDVPLIRQKAKDCGPAALSSVLTYWGEPTSAHEVRAALGRPQTERLKAGELREYARQRGFLAFAFYGSWSDIKHELENGRPVVVGVAKPYGKDRALAHYEVVVGLNATKQQILLMDPADGWRKNTLTGFESEWAPTKHITLVVFPNESKSERSASRE